MIYSPSRRDLMVGVMAVPLALAMGPSFVYSAETPTLQTTARERGRYFGAAVRIEQLKAERTLREQVVAQCAYVTPEIHLKWNSIENKRGRFNFEPVDQLVTFADNYGLKIHGHNLLWDKSTPEWARRAIKRDQDWSLVAGHIERVVSRYRDAIGQWDVINEPIDTVSGAKGLRRNSFHHAFGPSYIEQALRETRQHAPDAKLMINDYSFEYDNPVETDRRSAFLGLLETLITKGVPLDGVGIQAHLDLSKGALKPAIIGRFLQRIADLGLEIMITELDVKERSYRASTAERDQKVSDEVARYLDIALSQPAVKGVVTWGLSDRHSWLDAPNRGLPYDDKMQPKAMYHALRAALAG